MTAVALARLATALTRAGLVRRIDAGVPEFVYAIADDSRAVTPGAVFAAVRGAALDGHAFLARARDAGAVAAIVEDANTSVLPSIVVSDARRAVAVAAAEFYDWPARALEAVGVTGTNGKTTTVGVLRHLLDSVDTPAASIGTLGVLLHSAGEAFDGGAGLTTPGPVELQRVLRGLVDRGVTRVAMEASSHALDQRRLDGVEFAASVFTNLTRDHLDYHHTMSSYFAAKAKLVALTAARGTVVVNADDPAWAELPRRGHTVTFGLGASAGVRASDARYTLRGSEWRLHVRIGSHEEFHPVSLPLVGAFNIANALGASAAAIAMGMSAAAVAERLRTMPQVPGRLERLSTAPVVLRDYAHTPDALERALEAVRPFAPHGRLIVVFGCGGDRDPGKRPTMGAIAERLADHVILTSDNPRTEDPERILDAIESGMTRRAHERIEDRRAAIARALDVADRERDIVVLAGKGHETYQIRGTDKLPFDEAQIVRALLAERV